MTQQQQDQKIAEKVRLAIKQLQKADIVLVHLVSDQSPTPRILKTLMLPNITTAQLQSVLAADPQLSQDLCQCLGVTTTADPSLVCLTADVLNSPGQWWQHLVTGAGLDPAMTDSVYLDLISRFGGPATTVTVTCTSLPRLHLDMRTEGEGASETGWQFTQLVLHPSQLSILNTSERFVHLAGPPGCGKSLVLMLKVLDWVCQGKPALVVSTRLRSLATSHMLFHQLQQTAGSAASGDLQLHIPKIYRSVKSHAKTLLASLPPSSRRQLLVIADEADRRVNPLFNELIHQCQGLHLWTAGLEHGQSLALMTEHLLTEPLRSPPCVTREVLQGFGNLPPSYIHDYTAVPSPLPCDDLASRVVLHSGQGHDEKRDASGCYQCGMEVARVLQELHVGISTSSSPPPLRYRDVFLLTRSGWLNAASKPPWTRNVMLNGLRDAGVPVTVLNTEDASAVADVATMSGDDHVTATGALSIVSGLERPVVVWVQTDSANTVDDLEGRLLAMSRCTAKLIWVKPKT